MNALPDFTRARVLIAGDVMLDRYWFGDVSRISPEAPVPVVRVGRTEERLGGAANVAAHDYRAGQALCLVDTQSPRFGRPETRQHKEICRGVAGFHVDAPA